MTLRFVVDAQLPAALADRLSALGYFAEHVDSIGLEGAADADIWTYVVASHALLMTKDGDFVQLARRDPAGAQVVWIRLGNTRNRALWIKLKQALPEIVRALEAGDRIVEVG